MFRGHDTPDAELVRACLDELSHRGPRRRDLLRTNDELQARHAEHGELVGLLVGVRPPAWPALLDRRSRSSKRAYRGRPLGDLLSDVEQRAYLPLIAPGPARPSRQSTASGTCAARRRSSSRSSGRPCSASRCCGAGPRIPDDDASSASWSSRPSAPTWCASSSTGRRCCGERLERGTGISSRPTTCVGWSPARTPTSTTWRPARTRPGDRARRRAAPALRLKQATRPERSR